MDTQHNTNLDIWISGAFAVVIVDFLVYPIDTLKTRIQSPHYEQVYKNARTGTIKRNVLFRGLYQGVFSVVLSTIPASGAFFTTYEAVKSFLQKTAHPTDLRSAEQRKRLLPFQHSIPTPVINAISSSVGEMVSCSMLTPAEVIKQNAQMINNVPQGQVSQRGKHQGRGKGVTLQVLSRFRKRPWKLWSGYTALVGRNLPFTGLNFPVFEYVKERLVEHRKHFREHKEGGINLGAEEVGKEPVMERILVTGIAASVSGSFASLVTTPIDVVKTRMMLAASEDGGAVGKESKLGRAEARKPNAWAVGRQIFLDEGLRGLFRGGAIRVGWTAISLSIYLSIYEGGRFYLERKRRAQKIDERVEVRKSEGEVIV